MEKTIVAKHRRQNNTAARAAAATVAVAAGAALVAPAAASAAEVRVPNTPVSVQVPGIENVPGIASIPGIDAWIPSLGLSLSMRMDTLGWLMALIVTGVGALVMIYCRWYFAGKKAGGFSLGMSQRLGLAGALGWGVLQAGDWLAATARSRSRSAASRASEASSGTVSRVIRCLE